MNEQWIDDLRLLAEDMQATPPADLLDSVRQTMASAPRPPQAAAHRPTRTVAMGRRRAIAAAVVLLIVGMGITYHLTRQPAPETAGLARREAPGAEASAPTPRGTDIDAPRTSVQPRVVTGLPEGTSGVIALTSPPHALPAETQTQPALTASTPGTATDTAAHHVATPRHEQPATPRHALDEPRELTPRDAMPAADGRWQIALHADGMPVAYTGTPTRREPPLMAYAAAPTPDGPLFCLARPFGQTRMAALPAITRRHHDHPWRFGLSVSRSLSPRWSLATGLTYSLLHSEFALEQGMYSQTTDQTLHYIGLPVNASYTVWHNRRWSLYATAGGMVELLAASRVSVSSSPAGPTESEPQRVADHRPLWSLQGGVGMAYHPTTALSVYAEPGVSWYPHTQGRPQSYYTEHPLGFQMSLGLRYTLGR